LSGRAVTSRGKRDRLSGVDSADANGPEEGGTASKLVRVSGNSEIRIETGQIPAYEPDGRVSGEFDFGMIDAENQQASNMAPVPGYE
jgi:hypothetical protein